MSFSINTNIASLEAQNYLRADSQFQASTINKVTSGLRIVNSGDDAAGLAIANGLRADQAVLTQGIQNATDGLATLQTIDGGVNNISQLLDRASTLATPVGVRHVYRRPYSAQPGIPERADGSQPPRAPVHPD